MRPRYELIPTDVEAGLYTVTLLEAVIAFVQPFDLAIDRRQNRSKPIPQLGLSTGRMTPPVQIGSNDEGHVRVNVIFGSAFRIDQRVEIKEGIATVVLEISREVA